MSVIDGFTIAPWPAAHFGIGAVDQLPGVVRATGADRVVVVTDAALAATPVIATVMAMLADVGLPARLFTGVHPHPTTDDLAAGAEAVAQATAAAAASAEAAPVTATLKASTPSARPAGTPCRPAGRNAKAATEAVAALRKHVGLTAAIPDFGITEADFAQIAADALQDEVLANTPRQPSGDDIGAILLASAG